MAGWTRDETAARGTAPAASSFFPSADSFAMIRGGHIPAILGRYGQD